MLYVPYPGQEYGGASSLRREKRVSEVDLQEDTRAYVTMQKTYKHEAVS
jgi:hypothetical protein